MWKASVALASLLSLLQTTTALAASDKKLVLTGSSTMAPLVSEIAKRFEKENVGVRVDVQTGGSSRGIADAKQGTADIGMSSRALKGEEAKELIGTTLAMDGVAIVLHKDNPVKALTNDQITNMFTGKVTNWKDVGGGGGQIVVMNRAEGRSELELFTHYLGLKPQDVKASIIVGENAQTVKSVAGNKLGISYLSVGTAVSEAAAGAPIKALPLDGIEPSPETVQSGKFPMSRPLVLVTKGAPSGLAKKFIDFCLSARVHDLIKEYSFVPTSGTAQAG